jgi:serine/threonine-protein kinase
LGTLHGSAGRQNWLALVDPNGQVFSLMRQFDDPIGDERRFAFRLPSAAPGIYMVVAIASDAPLVRAGAMQDGTPAATILPLMMRELALDGQGAVDVAFLELTR